MEVPPTGPRWRYYLFGMAPPHRYRDWVIADIHGGRWPIRNALQMAGGALIGALLAQMFLDVVSPAAFMGAGLGMILGAMLTRSLLERHRDRTISRYEKRWIKQQTKAGV